MRCVSSNGRNEERERALGVGGRRVASEGAKGKGVAVVCAGKGREGARRGDGGVARPLPVGLSLALHAPRGGPEQRASESWLERFARIKPPVWENARGGRERKSEADRSGKDGGNGGVELRGRPGAEREHHIRDRVLYISQGTLARFPESPTLLPRTLRAGVVAEAPSLMRCRGALSPNPASLPPPSLSPKGKSPPAA